MRRIYFAIAIMAAGISCISCNRISPEQTNEGEGALTLNVDIDGSKAAMSADELLSSAKVNIYKADFSGLVRSYRYSEAPATIYLPVDSYRVDVEAGEMAKETPAIASWEQKSYKGSAKFNITAGNTQSVEVNANIANAVSKVTFDASVAENLSEGYTFTIGVSETEAAQQLVYTAANSGAEGYFIIPAVDPVLFWSFSGTVAKDGTALTATGKFENIEKGKLYKLTPKFTVRDGDLTFDLFVDYDTDIFSDVIIFDPVSTGLTKTKPMDIWAAHAPVYATVDEGEYSDPDKIKFAYSSNGTDWTTIDATRVSEGSYEGLMSGLQPSTTYTYKLVIDGEDVGTSLTLTTESAPQLPNYGFEVTSNAESSKWTSFYNPGSSDPSLQTKFWDSGSSASAGMLGADYAICYSDSDVPAGIGSTKSARLQSLAAAGKLAAGNLFTGSFAGLDGLNGKVNFGRPWTSRPTAVRFWYRYKGGKVDKTASGCPLTTNDYDRFQIKVALGTWTAKKYGGTQESPVQVNTNHTSTFYNYPDLPETVAYGDKIEIGNGSKSEWKQVTIPLTYYDTATRPAYIVVSGAASQYGDYFAGSSSSALWIDEFELLYE